MKKRSRIVRSQVRLALYRNSDVGEIDNPEIDITDPGVANGERIGLREQNRDLAAG